MASGRVRDMYGVILAALAAIAVWQAPAFAQSGLKLPMFSACKPTTKPKMPARWRAVALMMPPAVGQVDVGEFVYDRTLPAMRATLYGLESGATDLLITKTDTYLLDGPHDAPTGCTSLGRKFAPPPPQWLNDKAVCVGQAPIGATQTQWWKTPGFEYQVNMFWYRTKQRLPLRTLFTTRAAQPAIIGDYAMTYFPVFTPLPETKLAKLRDFCVAQAKKASAADATKATSARALMAIRNESAEAERPERIKKLIPGLDQKACSGMKIVRWPDQFVMTAIVSPTAFQHPPLPSTIFYDWTGAATQAAIMYLPLKRPPVPRLASALKKGIGYSIRRTPFGDHQCKPVHPGMVRPNWMEVAGCKCRGVLEPNAALGIKETVQILACPIAWQEPRVMWNWYTTKDRPVLFVEAGPSGSGLMLADYHQWLPGLKLPASNFKLPKDCKAADKMARPPVAGMQTSFSNPSCSDCHTTPW